MEALGIGHLKDKPLEDCSLATQQRTEIARAVARDSKVFLFDEPNSALTAEESDELFREMHKLAQSGRIVVLVTHRLADFVAHCSRVAIVRDGKVRVILEGDALTEDGIARQLVTESARDSCSHQPRQQTPRRSGACVSHARLDASQCVFATSTSKAARARSPRCSASRDPERANCCARWPGSNSAPARSRSATLSGSAALDKLTAYVPATRQLSLYSNFSVGENLLVRLGYPEIAGAGYMPESAPDEVAGADRRHALPGQDRHDHPADPLAVRRQPAEGGDRPGAALRAEAASAGGADARRRYPQQGRDLPAAARLCRPGQRRRHLLHRGAGSLRGGRQGSRGQPGTAVCRLWRSAASTRSSSWRRPSWPSNSPAGQRQRNAAFYTVYFWIVFSSSTRPKPGALRHVVVAVVEFRPVGDKFVEHRIAIRVKRFQDRCRSGSTRAGAPRSAAPRDGPSRR